MPTFKVVLDEIDLSEEQSSRISRSIQKSVMQELAALDNTTDDAGKSEPVSVALLAIGLGPTMGLVVVTTDPPDPKHLDDVVAREFGG
jgi:hypothetical protein